MIKNIKRNKRIKLASSSARIRTSTLWDKFLAIAIIFTLGGFWLAYWAFDGGDSASLLAKNLKSENEILLLNREVSELNIKIEMQKVALDRAQEEIKKIKEINNQQTEEILFYEKIVGKKSN